MPALRFRCPSCNRPLRPVEAPGAATLIVVRTCRVCRERWQLVVSLLAARDTVRLDRAVFTFLGRTPDWRKGDR